tara:strand:+ start:251 stop:943 length:693 start_codon:yes stop_codon:yes gene_type:complete
MPKSSLPVVLVVVPLLLVTGSICAQDLTLFEAVETSANAGGPSAAQAREQRNLPSGPAFTLLGTSRIGDTRRASLIDSDGKVLVVELSDQGSTPIPEYSGFSIVSLDSGKVSISMPEDTPCIGSSDKGVHCSSNGLAELSLTTAAPIVLASSQENNNGAPEQAGGAEEGQPENPFAAALRAAAQNEASAQSGRPRRNNGEGFEVRRIADEDVPPGMRKVRTPFGDRLVEL